MTCCSVCLEPTIDDEGYTVLSCAHRLHIECAIKLASCGQPHCQLCPVGRKDNVLPIVLPIVTTESVQTTQQAPTNVFATLLVSFMMIILFALVIRAST